MLVSQGWFWIALHRVVNVLICVKLKLYLGEGAKSFGRLAFHRLAIDAWLLLFIPCERILLLQDTTEFVLHNDSGLL